MATLSIHQTTRMQPTGEEITLYNRRKFKGSYGTKVQDKTHRNNWLFRHTELKPQEMNDFTIMPQHATINEGQLSIMGRGTSIWLRKDISYRNSDERSSGGAEKRKGKRGEKRLRRASGGYVFWGASEAKEDEGQEARGKRELIQDSHMASW